jgi:hypothetical protein
MGRTVNSLAPLFALRPQVWLLISTILYFFPYAVGSFQYRSPYGSRIVVEYHDGTIYAVALIFFCLAMSIFFIRDNKVDLSVNEDNRHEAIVLIFLISVFGIYTLMTPQLFEATKSDVLESTNRGHYLFYSICSVGVIFSFLSGWKKNRDVLFISVIGLFLVLYIGHRSALAITVAGFIYLRFRNSSLTNLKIWHVIGAFALVFALAVYKSIYVAIKMGDFGAVRDRLLENPLVDNAVVGLEQFVTFAHLDFVVTYDYSLPCSNLWAIPISLIPFMDEFIDVSACGYNVQVQQVFFSAYPGGVAANIWAEFFANFGYAGIPLLVLILVAVCKLVEYFISKSSSAVIKAGLILSIIQLTVYIQRKELMGAFISAKRVILVALLVYAGALILRMLTSRRPRPA